MVGNKSTEAMDEEKGGLGAEMLGVKRICFWRRATPRPRWPGAAIWLEVYLLWLFFSPFPWLYEFVYVGVD